MMTQAPPSPHAPEVEIDAGVIKEARARQRRQRIFAAVSLAVAAFVALLVFGGSGGGGPGVTRHGRGNGSNPTGAHTASQVGPATAYSPPTIGASGLLGPGVGWAVNGLGFYMTWDGGQHWSDVHVPELSGDVLAGFMAASSPNPLTLVLSIADSGSAYGTCADPVGEARRPIGAIAVSSNAGHAWRTSPFPGCSVATQISFINARVGFAVSGGRGAAAPALLYGTTDGGRGWHRIGALPRPGPIDFTTIRSGWLLGGNRIYRTADGGKTWQRTNACGQPTSHTITLLCGPPRFFGADGAVQVIRAVAGVADGTYVKTTRDAGLTWNMHSITVGHPTQGRIAALMSASSPADLFAYFRGGVMARSTDGGRTWQTLPAPRFRGAAAINFVSARYGWIQDGGSIYATSDGGERWQRMKQTGNQPPTP